MHWDVSIELGGFLMRGWRKLQYYRREIAGQHTWLLLDEKGGNTNGTKTKTAAAGTWVGLVLEAGRGYVGIPNPLKGFKKPRAQPRLQSFSKEDEKALYEATEECFRNFLFAAIHTGLRPFCELARITADDVEEANRGMMWRVYRILEPSS